jgi:hypothetical protein
MEMYFWVTLFFILGFLMSLSITVGWRKKAVDDGRMLIKSGDEWKGTREAVQEIIKQLGSKPARSKPEKGE